MGYISRKTINYMIDQLYKALNQVDGIFVTGIYNLGNRVIADFKSTLVENKIKHIVPKDKILHLTRGSIELKKEHNYYIVTAHIPTLKPKIPHPVEFIVLHPQAQYFYVNNELKPVSYFVAFTKRIVDIGDIPYNIFLKLGYNLK